MKLTNEQTKTLEFLFENNKARYYNQDLETANISDASQSLVSGELVGLVDEAKGGIIGYIMEDSIDEVQSLLNLQQYSNESQSTNISQWEYLDNACGSVWNALKNSKDDDEKDFLSYIFHALVSAKNKHEE